MTSPHPRSPRFLVASVALVAVSVVGVCAIAQPVSATAKPSKAARTKTAVPAPFPKLKVLDLATAKTIDLATLNITAKPQLIWFWAPT